MQDKKKRDLELIERIKGGDDLAATKLLSFYRATIFKRIYRAVENYEDAEEIMFKSFAQAFLAIDRFNPEYSFMTWIAAITKRNICVHLRTKNALKRRAFNDSIKLNDLTEEGIELNEVIPITDTKLNQEESLTSNERYEGLVKFLQMLPEKYQPVIKLRFFEEKSYEEIVEILQIPKLTVIGHIYYARELTKKFLKESSK